MNAAYSIYDFLLERIRPTGTLADFPGPVEVLFSLASYGEFVQCRPLIDRMRQGRTAAILFHSRTPHGVDDFERYPLPRIYFRADTSLWVRSALDALRPRLVVFNRHEIWPRFLEECRVRGVRTALVNTARKPGGFLRSRWRQFLYERMDLISFVSEEDRDAVLRQMRLSHPAVAAHGDTRLDGLIAEPGEPDLPMGRPLLVLGSTLPRDHRLLLQVLPELVKDWHIAWAPHRDSSFAPLEKALRQRDIPVSRLSRAEAEARVLLLDRRGRLRHAYSQADAAYVGAGYSRAGVHNVLEPSLGRGPVMFGPRYEHDVFALELVRRGAAFPVHTAGEFLAAIRMKPRVLSREILRSRAGAARRTAEALDSLLGAQ